MFCKSISTYRNYSLNLFDTRSVQLRLGRDCHLALILEKSTLPEAQDLMCLRT